MKKIAIGIIDVYGDEAFLKCKNSLPSVDYIFNVHSSSKSSNKSNISRYISYGGLFNILLRDMLKTDATYLFLIKSNVIIENSSVIADYINTAATFGTWFMSRGHTDDKFKIIEDDKDNVSLNLFENLSQDFIFMLSSHIKHCGFFNEGYTNVTDDKNNCLEIYDFYNKLEQKIQYLPKGYFPDTPLSQAKISLQNINLSRPSLKESTTDNTTKIYGQFYYTNKFIPTQHKTATLEDAVDKLEKIQKIYGATT